MNGETSREGMTNPSSSTPASPLTEPPALAHLLEVAAKIVRREYLPTLESCKNIGQARTLIARYSATHAALGMELKSIFDKLTSVRAAIDTEPTVEDGIGILRKLEGCTGDAVKLILLKNFVMRSVRAASTGTGWISGWESGRDDAAARLCEEIISWESEARCNDTTSWEKDFINKRIGQIKTHIAQIREIPLPFPPVASQKGKEEE